MEKAPSEKDITERLQAGKYNSRYELCRDLALNLYWVNRYALTMYEERPTRWSDMARNREDVSSFSVKPVGFGSLVRRPFRMVSAFCARNGNMKQKTKFLNCC